MRASKSGRLADGVILSVAGDTEGFDERGPGVAASDGFATTGGFAVGGGATGATSGGLDRSARRASKRNDGVATSLGSGASAIGGGGGIIAGASGGGGGGDGR